MYQTDPDFVDFVSQEIDGYEKVYWIYFLPFVRNNGNISLFQEIDKKTEDFIRDWTLNYVILNGHLGSHSISV